jgi:chaperonin GroEL
MLADIGVLTAGVFLAEDLGRSLEDVELKELGTAKKVVISKDETTLVQGGGKTKDIQARAAQIQMQIDRTTSDYDREKLQERLAKMVSGVAVISVGGATEVAMKEAKDRVDDALHATRAAAKEGFVPGGGVALVRAVDAVLEAKKKAKGDEKYGFDIVAIAMTRPCEQIAENAGFDGDLVVEKIRESKSNMGFNAATGAYEDLVKSGIIDPALVMKTALLNAASVAGLMLTTDVIITELKDETLPVEGAVV